MIAVDLVPRGRLRSFASDAGPLFAAVAVLNASNYGFHIAVTRALGPAHYGQLASLLAVLLVLSVPFGVVQTLVAKRAAALDHDEDPAELTAGILKAVVPLSVLPVAALGVATPLVARFLHATSSQVLLLAPYCLLSVVFAVQSGVLQGRLRFRALASLTLVGVAARLGVGLGLVYAGFGVTGALVGTLAAHVAAICLGAALLGTPRSWRLGRPSLEPFRGETLSTLVALGSFWLLAELDILLARHYLSGTQSGVYSSAAVVARALLFLPSAIATVALPRFTAARERPVEIWGWLVTALRLLIGLLAVGLVVLFLLRFVVIGVAFGDRYRDAAQLLPLLAAGSAVLALMQLLVYFHVAVGSRAYVFVGAAVVLEAGAISLFHGSGNEIGACFLGATAVAAVLQLHAAKALTMHAPALRGRTRYATVAGRRAAGGDPDLSLVLPCHNASGGLERVLDGLREELSSGPDYEVIVVSDGSTDDTVAVASAALDERMRVIHYPERVGKGQALRIGLGEASGRYVAFIDGDGDIDPRSVRALVDATSYEPDVVLASKRHPGSAVRYPRTRRVLSWGYHKLGLLLFRVDVSDTQTGLKLIRRDALEAVLPKLLEKRFAFDLELLVAARRHGFARVVETPVRIDYRFSSTVRPGTVARILVDTLAVFYRRYVLDSYRPDAAQRRVPTRRAGALRILVVNWRDIRHPESGGAEVWTHEVARRWAAAGHEVSLLTSGFSGAPAVETIDGVQIRRRGRLRNGSFHLLVQCEFARIRDVDVVVDEINSVPFLSPLWRRRVPHSVALIHQLADDVWDAELPRPLAAVARRIEPRLLGLYRSVPTVTMSESTAADLRRIGLRRVRVIATGGERPPVGFADLEKESRPTFLFVGRLVANKRPHHAVDAFRAIAATLPDARLWVIGSGPLEDALRRTLPRNAELLGHIPLGRRAELYERMARAHCLLVPSVREGWGLVVNEANSVGTPAVGYDVPGLRDSIRDGVTGLLAPAGKPQGLADAAVGLVTDPERYERIRRGAIERSTAYSWDKTAAQLLAVVEERLSEAMPGGAEVMTVAPRLAAAGAPEHG